jgi:hypothetical protein
MIAVAGVDEEKSRPANLQPVKEALEFFVESLPKQAKADARSKQNRRLGGGRKSGESV